MRRDRKARANELVANSVEQAGKDAAALLSSRAARVFGSSLVRNYGFIPTDGAAPADRRD